MMKKYNRLLVFLIFVSLIMICLNEDFCDKQTVDSAFTVGEHTYLIRDGLVWCFTHKDKNMSDSLRLNQFIKDFPEESVDAAFVYTQFKDSEFTIIVYIFSKGRYFLFSPQNRTNPATAFPIRLYQLNWNQEELFKPFQWKDSGNLSDINNGWFPSNIDDAVVVKNSEIFLFHGNWIRPTHISKAWPEDKSKEECRFGSSPHIDSIFSIPGGKNIITKGTNMCEFEISIERCSLSQTNCSSEWNASYEFFGCPQPINETTQPSDTTVSEGMPEISTKPKQSKETTTENDYDKEEPAEVQTLTTISTISSASIAIIIVLIVIIITIVIASLSIIMFVSIRNANASPSSVISNDENEEKTQQSKQLKSASSVYTINSITGLKVEEN